MATGNPDYYATRAAKERAMAEAATDRCARESHLQMAEQYQQRAESAKARLGTGEVSQEFPRSASV